jgi:two-component system OmpR family sensor kinase
VVARGDRSALLLATGNLVGNARKHGPEAAPVTVRVRRDRDRAVVEVRDEGKGLSEADAARAFDRFWRSDPGREGSGLGLAIVRAVVQRHGGTVGVRGSTFTLRLPAATVRPGAPEAARILEERGTA